MKRELQKAKSVLELTDLILGCIYTYAERHTENPTYQHKQTYLGNGYTEPFKWSSEVEAVAVSVSVTDAEVGLLSHSYRSFAISLSPKTCLAPRLCHESNKTESESET